MSFFLKPSFLQLPIPFFFFFFSNPFFKPLPIQMASTS